MTRAALVLGATGLVGSRCVAHLARSSTYGRVRCLVRRSGAIAAAPDLEERVVDFDALTDEDVAGVDDVFCAIGTTMKKAGSKEAFRRIDHTIPLDVATRAHRGGAKRMILVSSVGASAGSSTFYLRTKGELEDALAALSWTALHVLRPSFLLGERGENRPGEAIGIAFARGVSGLLLGGLRKYRAIEADDVGRAMVVAAAGADPDSKGRPTIHEYDAIRTLATGTPPSSSV